MSNVKDNDIPLNQGVKLILVQEPCTAQFDLRRAGLKKERKKNYRLIIDTQNKIKKII